MPLELDGEVLPSDLSPEALLRRLLEAPLLRERTERFLETPTRRLGVGDGAVYVAQQESGVAYGGLSAARFLGSSEATTCVIALVRGDLEGGLPAALCAHMDLQTRGQPQHFALEASSLFGESVAADLYLLGGYRDDGVLGRWESWPILSEVISALHASTSSLRLRVSVAAVHERNTTTTRAPAAAIPTKFRSLLPDGDADVEVPRPRKYGLAVDLSTGEAFPADFLDRGAAPALRMLVWSEDGPAFQPYQPATDTYEFKAPVGGPKMEPLEVYERVTRFSDDEILWNFSTSPLVEPATFCEECRTKCRVAMSIVNPNAAAKPSWLEALKEGKRLIFRRKQRLSTADTSDESSHVGEGWELVSQLDSPAVCVGDGNSSIDGKRRRS